MAKILVIEDEENLRFTIRKTLAKASHEVAEASALGQARKLVERTDFDLVLTDLMLGGENGLDFVKELRERHAYEGVIVVMTAFSTVETAVSAMRQGADDYLQKPLSLEELALQAEKWLDHKRLAKRVKLYERLEQAREQNYDAIGESPAWTNALALANRLAAIPIASASTGGENGAGGAFVGASGATLPCILLVGETGVGKGVLARYLHARAVAESGSGDAPFVHVNCSALPANLVEGELFGHEKGAFTDARDARPGLFEMADGGTIFLDEISEMPMDVQSKLLLVVEHGRFRRIGGTKERHVRVRIVAASNQDLDERVKAGAFRRDLLYRLNAFTIKIPPLRDRGEDSVLIAEATVERLAKRYGRPRMRLSAGTAAAIREHDWPGNVRELVNAAQRAVMLADHEAIEPVDLGLIGLGSSPGLVQDNGEPATSHVVGGAGGTGGSVPVFDFERGVHRAADVEKELIMQALRFTHGNVSRAAKVIGMQRSSLRYRIERYRLDAFVVEVART